MSPALCKVHDWIEKDITDEFLQQTVAGVYDTVSVVFWRCIVRKA